MTQKMTRREFAKKTAAMGVVAASTPTMLIPAAVKPVVISSANGNWFKNGGTVTAVQKAFEMLTKGADVLDAVVAGVNIVELDPEDDSVGYGGLPNAEGVVQLDSCCMHGPRKQAGGVAALEGIRTPSLVAKTVLEQTDHHLLVGKGAQSFAHSMGFKVEDDLNTEHSRKIWLEWKRRTDPQHYLNPKERSAAQERVLYEMVHEGILRAGHLHGTINCDGINSKGEICGVTTTSGLAWKIPGRVGDSPILGAGLYVDGAVGAAGSTGRGEANLYNLSSYLIVENMRRGMSPKDAGLDALKRIKANTVEKRLLKPDGNPKFNMQFYILNARGEFSGVAMYGEDEGERGWAGQKEGRKVRYAVCDENGPRFMACEGLLPGLAGEVYP